jgi:hypothetical protein
MLWSKQYFYYDLAEWLREHGDKPEKGVRAQVRNKDWFHLYTADVISMPDKWEYPWFAVWDLAFHTIPLSVVDVDFAKEQLKLFLGHHYLHPNGQIPAYEWNFGDVNCRPEGTDRCRARCQSPRTEARPGRARGRSDAGDPQGLVPPALGLAPRLCMGRRIRSRWCSRSEGQAGLLSTWPTARHPQVRSRVLSP